MVTINGANDLVRMIRCGETSKVQFKQKFSSQKQIADEMVAFANSRGGVIIFGVEDKTGSIVGLDYNEIQAISRELGNAANEQVKPTIYLQTEVMEVGDKALLLAYIDEGVSKPYKDLSGNIYVKQGADKRRITENAEMLRLFHQSRLYLPDEEPVVGTSADDLDDKRLDRFLEKSYGKGRDDFDVPFKTLLNNLKITAPDGSLTLAGLLFFGKHPEWVKPSFIIKAVAFYGNSIGDTQYKDSRDMDGTIPEQFEQAMKFLDNNLHHIQAGQSFNSLGILEVSRIALEEILQNALVHREYIKTAPIRLLVFADRIEIISPGCLPGNMTIEGIQLGETFQRNPLLASFCAKTMVYRGLGSGIVRAKKDGAKIEFRNDEVTNQFITTIWRQKLDEKSASLDEKGLSLDEKGLSLDEKGLSLDEKGPSLDEKGPSLDEKGPSLNEKEPSKQETLENKLLSYCMVPRSISEISLFLEMSNKSKLRKKYVIPLVGKKLAMTLPDIPSSPKQKYYTIRKNMGVE